MGSSTSLYRSLDYRAGFRPVVIICHQISALGQEGYGDYTSNKKAHANCFRKKIARRNSCGQGAHGMRYEGVKLRYRTITNRCIRNSSFQQLMSLQWRFIILETALWIICHDLLSLIFASPVWHINFHSGRPSERDDRLVRCSLLPGIAGPGERIIGGLIVPRCIEIQQVKVPSVNSHEKSSDSIESP